MDEQQMLDLLTRGERELRAAFAEVILYLREQNQLGQIEDLIRAGHVDTAILEMDKAAAKIVERIEAIYTRSALSAAQAITEQGSKLVSYQATNPSAVAQLQELRLDMIRDITDQQRAVTRQLLQRGLERGDNPRTTARALRESIGLTAQQEQYVANYQAQLERGRWAAARSRQLHDGRGDQTMRAAERRSIELTDTQIETMVSRYRANFIAYRAENIARTETLRATHMGSEQLYEQAIERFDIDPTTLVCTWHSGAPPRTRNWHASMNGQTRDWGQDFITGHGIYMRYPGDEDAPSEEVVNCRCVRSVRIAGRRGREVMAG